MTEAVSILRDEIRRGQSEWGPTRLSAALETVLAALHQARDVVGGAQQRVLDLEAERDAAIEEAVDEQTRSIKAALMDAQHQEALDIEALSRLEAERDALSEELGEVLFERDALRDKLSSVTEDYLKERNAATAAEAERDALRLDLAEACE